MMSGPNYPQPSRNYRKRIRALISYQSEDGTCRKVVDEPTSYRELTVAAMMVAAMAICSERSGPTDC
jgi:rhamnogalacturonyl hydrolase YesR